MNKNFKEDVLKTIGHELHSIYFSELDTKRDLLCKIPKAYNEGYYSISAVNNYLYGEKEMRAVTLINFCNSFETTQFSILEKIITQTKLLPSFIKELWTEKQTDFSKNGVKPFYSDKYEHGYIPLSTERLRSNRSQKDLENACIDMCAILHIGDLDFSPATISKYENNKKKIGLLKFFIIFLVLNLDLPSQ